jgi:hypothetical protein
VLPIFVVHHAGRALRWSMVKPQIINAASSGSIGWSDKLKGI